MKILLAVILLLVVGMAGLGIWFVQRGFSAKAEPTRIEAAVARRLRHLSVPSSAKAMSNPMPASPEMLKMGMAHFADHCAACHANDGSGNTEMGKGLYPKAPDMRLDDTQSLSDGELFYIIENGVRFTGMPAWSTGTPEGASGTWHLVQFIRHLPAMTSDELKEMESLNPKTPSELREEQEDQDFLSGSGTPTEPAGHEGAPAPHQHQ